MPVKRSFIVLGSAGAAVLLAVILVFAGMASRAPRAGAPKPWNPNTVRASYVASQLRQVDKAHAALFLAYDLDNGTDLDYRLDEPSGVIIMARLKSDGSLSQEEPVRLSYPVFLPAHQRVRVAIQVLQPFTWPAPADPRLDDKLKDFVKQRLANTQGFILFNEAGRLQVELPNAWPELAAMNGANN